MLNIGEYAFKGTFDLQESFGDENQAQEFVHYTNQGMSISSEDIITPGKTYVSYWGTYTEFVVSREYLFSGYAIPKEVAYQAVSHIDDLLSEEWEMVRDHPFEAVVRYRRRPLIEVKVRKDEGILAGYASTGMLQAAGQRFANRPLDFEMAKATIDKSIAKLERRARRHDQGQRVIDQYFQIEIWEESIQLLLEIEAPGERPRPMITENMVLQLLREIRLFFLHEGRFQGFGYMIYCRDQLDNVSVGHIHLFQEEFGPPSVLGNSSSIADGNITISDNFDAASDNVTEVS